MTSRTPTGVQPRQPQRGLGSTQQVQRPTNTIQRSVSASQQQFLTTSPSRRDSIAPPDSNPDTTDISSTHHASTPRRQGSRLRLELSSDLVPSGPSSAMASPQSLTPSRMMPLSDATETGSASPALSRASQQDGDNPALPMPQRRLPTLAQSVRSNVPRTASSAPPKKDTRPRPYTVEVPAVAPRYATASRPDLNHRDPFTKGLFSGHADFFSWSGNHHEDDWSTEAIQKGTWDRGNQNEASSARLAIFPALKQKSGLNALSTIFMGVLNKRRHRGQITAPSTFKPPPRVTLTDTKREIWLKDLANPAISLRRLSRTIPHGIRGRTLLDQCLNKDVPAERAVWLAKCVGANEIRASKRKGASGAFVLGGEMKWIRDWTVFVEQFVEAVVSTFGEPDWKVKVTYAIRLAACFYSEQLLDRDHYLEWIISGLETSAQSRIPMWILIAQIYWSDLLQLRKCGKRLVFALLNHLHNIENDPDRDILMQLSSELSTLLIGLAKTNPESFICPPAWQHFAETLRLVTPADDAAAQAAYGIIKLRNARLSVTNTTSLPEGRQYLVQLLDSTLQGKGGPDLSAKCWATTENKSEIIKTAVEWATSQHRPRLAKLYVATELIRSWELQGVHATSEILDILGDVAPTDKIKKKAMIRLVAELVRRGNFSVPRYLQWLIGRGGLHTAQEIDPVDGPCASRLLVELPVHCLSGELASQRANLLRRAGNYSVSDEVDNTRSALACVDVAVGLTAHMQPPNVPRKPLPLRKLLRMASNSSRAVQSAIGHHLFDTVTSRLSQKSGFVMTLPKFCSLRDIMESIEDFSMFGGILKSCCNCSDPEVVAACVDTLNANLEIFTAMGCAETLFDMFIERLKTISREQGVVIRSLLAALSSLAPRIPQREALAKQLSMELAQNDRSNALDACSPVSDSMAAQAQTAEGEISEQIDKLLASGNVIDHPTMNRLFRYIAPKLEAGWVKLDENRRVFASLLSRLRMLDAPHFDKLMADWVGHVRTLKSRPSLPELFPLLVVVGCLSITTVLHTSNISPLETGASTEATMPMSATYLQELLQLMIAPLPRTAILEPEEAYRFRIQQRIAQSEHAKPILLLIRNALVEYAALQPEETSELPLDGPVFQECLLETMRLLVVADSANVADVLSMGTLPSGAMALAHRVVTKLLLPEDNSEQHPSFDKILSLANDLTIPFCQLKLNLDLATNLGGSAGGRDEEGSVRFEGFAKAMDHAIESQNIMWTSMLPCLSDDITQGLNIEVHTRFLDLMPSSKSGGTAHDVMHPERTRLAQNLLGVIEAIISGQPPSRQSALTPSLADKLADMWEMIASRDAYHHQPDHGMEILDDWLPLLLRFIILHSASPEASDASLLSSSSTSTPGAANAQKALPTHTTTTNHEARARIVVVLCGLLLELESLPCEVTGSLGQQVLDIAMLLADGLPDDVRVQCAKSMLFLPGSTASTSTSSDPRLYYVLSTPRPSAAAENLKLLQRDRINAPPPPPPPQPQPHAHPLPHTSAQPQQQRGMGAVHGLGSYSSSTTMMMERMTPFVLRRWEILSEPTPNVGENDTSLSLSLFEAIKLQ